MNEVLCLKGADTVVNRADPNHAPLRIVSSRSAQFAQKYLLCATDSGMLLESSTVNSRYLDFGYLE